MKKVLFSCLLAAGFLATAQIGPPQSNSPNTNNGYGFTQSSGTYTPLSASKTIWQSGATIGTNGASSAVTIPSFSYNGKSYTSIFISNNGFITFGNAPVNGTTSGLSTNSGAPNIAQGAIAGFSADLVNANTTTSEIAYELVGSKFIVQYTDLKVSGGSSSQLINFQIQLDSSNNSIAIVYGNCVSGTATASGQVGIRGSESSDTSNRTGTDWTATTGGTALTGAGSSCTLGTSNANTVPVSGLTFTYVPGTWLMSPPPYATLPYTNDFSNWINGNSTADLPGVNWRTWPSRGDNSWRANNHATTAGLGSPSGWSDVSESSTSSSSVASPAVAPTARFHSYQTSAGYTGYMDLYVDLSTGGSGDRVISFDYRNESGSDKLDLLISTDGGLTFTQIGSSIGVQANTWSNKVFVTNYTASNAIIRFLATGDFGSNDILIDNLSILVNNQPPACSTVSTPANNATAVSRTPTFTWAFSTYATSYLINLGTTPGGTDVMSGVDVGNATTYAVPAASALLYGTQYYLTVIPKNAFGNASGCTESTFKTLNLSCPSVTAPANSAVNQPTNPTITWSSTTGAASYRLSVGTTPGGTDILNNFDVGNVLTYQLSGLSNSTTYYYTVNSATAYNTTSSSCTERTFTTVCSPTTAPYAENFDTTSTGSSTNANAPTCWSYVETASSAAYGYVTSSSPSSAPNCYILFNSSATTSTTNVLLVSPQTTNLMDGTKRVRFLAKAGGSSYTVQVGTLSNITDPTTFSIIGSAINLTQSWAVYTVDIPAGTNQYLAFRHGLGGSSRSVYLDDIFVENVPTCIEPTAVTSSAITSNSANLGWTAPSSVPANGYEVYYSTTNTAPTASTVLTTSNSTISTTTSAALNNLSSATTYYAWVRSVCSATDKSVWTAIAVNFTTLCVPVVPNYTNDFSTFPGNCWSQTSGGTATSPGTGTSAYWINDGFLNVGSSGSARYNAYDIGRAGFLKTVAFDLSGGTYRVKFDYGLTNYNATTAASLGSDDVVQFVVSQDGGATWTVLKTWNASTPISNTSTLYSFDLVGYNSNNTIFGFYATDGTVENVNNDVDFFIDNFTVESTIILATTEISKKNENIKIYPNPFSDVLNISDIEKVKSISIMDASGKMVRSFDKPEAQLRLSDLNAGMYIVILNMKDGSRQTIKAIKK